MAQIVDLIPDLKPTILAARQVRDSRNMLAQWLPNHAVMGVSYRMGRKRRADVTAPIRGIDAPATPILRPGVLDIRGDLPAITPIVQLTEQDLTNEMIAAQMLAGIQVDWTPSVNSAAAEGALVVDNTLEAMRGQALSALKVSLTSADGVVHEADFGADPSQTITVTTAWNAAGAKPFEDFEAAHSAYADRAGNAAGAVLTTRKVRSRLLAALQVLYPNSPVGEVALGAYLADRGLPEIVTYDRTFTSVTGVKSRVYPEGYMTFLPDGDTVGKTELGVTQEAIQQVGRNQPNGAPALTAAETPGLTVVTLGNDNPVQRSVKVAALGMPVLHDIEQISVVKGIFG